MPLLRFLADTNVLVAAAGFPGSPPSEFVGMLSRGLFEVIVTDALLREAVRAFAAEFGRGAGREGYRLLARMPRRHVVWAFQWEHLEREVGAKVFDKGDVPHVCAYIVARGDLFVTLDTKLTRMPIRESVRFARPADAARRIREDVGRSGRQ